MKAVAVCNKCCGLRPLQVTDGYLQFEGPKGPDGYHVLYIDEYEYEDAMSGGWHRCCCPHYLAREAAAREEWKREQKRKAALASDTQPVAHGLRGQPRRLDQPPGGGNRELRQMEQTQTKAQTFCEVVAAKLAALREAKGLVEYMLYDPSDEVIDAITSNGGRILRDGYEKTCHSDTCAHNSHDAGYEYAYVEVSSSWLERPTDEVFDFNADGNEVGVMLIPADPPIAVFRHDCGCGFADWSGIAGLRPYVADAIGFLEDDDIDDADEIDCRDIPL